MQCSLPPLPNLYFPKTAEERLHNPDKKRLMLHAFKAHCEGPSDSSCWVVPGRIAMGGYPLGRARAKVSQCEAMLAHVPHANNQSSVLGLCDCLLTSPPTLLLHFCSAPT